MRAFTGAGGASSLPSWLAWIAILIDYLELPVIADTLKKFVVAVRTRRVRGLLHEEPAD